jgi:5-(carboxyamino)imidazole ribonucleotide synthase
LIIGVLGAGQLGRMLALAGYPLGLRLRFFDPTPDAAAGEIAPLMTGSYNDHAALQEFAKGLDAVTYEFENVPVEAARALGQWVPVLPGPRALEVAQDRLVEKDFFRSVGVEPAPYRQVDSPSDAQPAVMEGFVPFRRELSLLSVRSATGEVRCWPLVENEHRDGILHLSRCPARESTDGLQEQANAHARAVLEGLDYVGVLALEFFELEGRLLVNEMAPRVHNSGHWTIEGAQCSQFENHLRAVAGLPLGSTELRGYSAMLNLVGDTPPTAELAACEGLHVHLYGKEPRPGRKLGHMGICSSTAAEREAVIERAESLLRKSSASVSG